MKERRPLPTSWSWARFDDVAEVESDLVSPQAHDSAPHIAPNHIESGTGRLLEYQTVAADAVTSPKHRFRAGQVLYSKIRPYLAKAVLVDFNGLCSADMYPVRSDIEARFLHRWLISHEFTALASSHQGRTVLPKINQVALNVLPVPVPPLNEQRRIVARIEQLTTRSRAAREALEQVPPLLERFRQSVLAAAFRGDLTAEWRRQHPDVEPASVLLERIRAERRHRWEEAELAAMCAKGKEPASDKWKAAYEVPETDPDLAHAYGDVSAIGWNVAPLEGLADAERGIPYGIVKTGDPCPQGVPTVRCGDIKEFSIKVAELKRVHPDLDVQYERTRLRGGEVLLAIRGSVGECTVAGPNMAGMNISREVAMIPVLDGVSARYVMYLLASPVGRRCVAVHVKGVAQAGINLADLRRLPVPLPPLAEQVEVVRRIDTLLSVADSVRRKIAEGHARLARIDQAILAKAFRGELVPQDPTDEPASVLLERIHAERETASSRAGPRTRRVRRANEADEAPHAIETAAGTPSTNGNGSTLQTILGALKREALHRIADAEGVELADRRSLDAARAGLTEGGVSLEALLEHLDRDELKAVCRSLGLEDRGRTKQELRVRVCEHTARR